VQLCITSVPATNTASLSDTNTDTPAAQSQSELSLATRSGPRTIEATCGNGYAPVSACPRWWWWW